MLLWCVVPVAAEDTSTDITAMEDTTQQCLLSVIHRNGTKMKSNQRSRTKYSVMCTMTFLICWHTSTIHSSINPLRPTAAIRYSYKASCARPGIAVVFNFLHPGTLTHMAACQSAQMSKITNDGLTRSGTGCFIAVPMWQQWGQRVNHRQLQ